MKGDFSKLEFDQAENFRGVLFQQGRVHLDTDLNAVSDVMNDWQQAAGHDAFGANRLSYYTDSSTPANHQPPFMIKQATYLPPVLGSQGPAVGLELATGEAWADGMRVVLGDGDGATVKRIATPYPSQKWTYDPTAHDAVVLEVWNEGVSAFQAPETLLEPALGGPDTTERMQTQMAYRLVRLKADQSCADVLGQLPKFPITDIGKVQVKFDPVTTQTTGSCPVTILGGYTGLEHLLYRIEIALTDQNDGKDRYKYSRFNGGMVGRAYATDSRELTICANAAPVGLQSWGTPYLEIFERDTGTYPTGRWKLIYAGTVSVNTSGTTEGSVTLTNTAATSDFFGSFPLVPASGADPTRSYFFRLWDGIQEIGKGADKTLGCGITLDFTGKVFDPFSYWTFKARASMPDANVSWPAPLPPEGPVYHRASLGIIDWSRQTSGTVTMTKTDSCGQPFLPLPEQNRGGCCIKIYPGDDINAAVEKVMKKHGGCIEFMPGIHKISKQINLAKATDILFFGRLDQVTLEMTDEFKGKALFCAPNSINLRFERFRVRTNGGSIPVWDLSATQNISIKEIIATPDIMKPFADSFAPVILAEKTALLLQVERCILLGCGIMQAGAVDSCLISKCIAIGVNGGVWIGNAFQLQVQDSFFFAADGLHEDAVSVIKNQVGSDANDTGSGAGSVTDAQWAAMFMRKTKAANAPTNTKDMTHTAAGAAFQINAIEFSAFTRNKIGALYGLRLTKAGDTDIAGNTFATTVVGVDLGSALQMRIRDNTFGLSETAVTGSVGIWLREDLSESRIENNQFLKNQYAILALADHSLGLIQENIEVESRMIQDGVFSSDPVVSDFISQAQMREKAISSESDTGLTGVARIDDITICGNKIEAVICGIYLRGNSTVGSILISGNFFASCSSAAVYVLVPSKLQYFESAKLAITGNSMSISGPALLAQADWIEFSDNDVSIAAKKAKKVAQRPVWSGDQAMSGFTYASSTLLSSRKELGTALSSNDTASLLMLEPLVKQDCLALDDTTDLTDYRKALAAVPDAAPTRDTPENNFLLMQKAYVGQKNVRMLATHLAARYAISSEQSSACVVGLRGIRGRIENNDIESAASAYGVGILCQYNSGVIRGNRVYADSIAIQLAGSMQASLPDGEAVEINGNTAAATGPNGIALQLQEPVGANFTIANNQFYGDVLIGKAVYFEDSVGVMEEAVNRYMLGYANYPWTTTYDRSMPAQKVAFPPPPMLRFLGNQVSCSTLLISGSDLSTQWGDMTEVPVVVCANNILSNTASDGRAATYEIFAQSVIITGNYSGTQPILCWHATSGYGEVSANIPQANIT